MEINITISITGRNYNQEINLINTMEQYYIFENENKKGPLNLKKLIELDLSEDTLVWKKGLNDWTELKNLSEYKKSIPPPTPKSNIFKKYDNLINKRIDESLFIVNTPHIDIKDESAIQESERLNHKNASFGLRFAAFIIDFLFIFFSTSFLWAIFQLPIPLNSESIFLGNYFIFKNPLGFIFTWLFYASFESSRFQATPGKTILGLTVTTKYFEKIGFGQASGRFFGKILSGLFFGIGYIMIGFTKKRQGLHDKMAHTLVLENKPEGVNRKPTSWIILSVSALLFLVSLFIPANTELFDTLDSFKTNEDNIESNSNSDYNQIHTLVQSWNKTHQNYDFNSMHKLYSDKVLYYGQEMANKDIVLTKQSFMKKYTDFNQNILGDLSIEYLDTNKMKVSFIKQASFDGKNNEYLSYLEVKKTNLEWKICTESDNVTDKNLANKNKNKDSSKETALKRTYIKNNNVFVEFVNNKKKQVTYNSKDSDPILINANKVFFVRKHNEEDNYEVALMTVEVDTQKEKIIKVLDSLSCFEEPKISNDKKHIYYLDCIYATSYGLIKLNIYTGESQQLHHGYWYHEIESGSFKDFILIYTSGIEENKGRQFYYRLCNNNGETYKTFEDEEAMNNFTKANNINL